MDPGLAGLEAHRLAVRVAEREAVEDVGPRPSDVLTLAVAEDGAISGADQRHVELLIAGRIETERGSEVDLRLDDDDVLRGDRFTGLAVDLAHRVIEARVGARRRIVAVADGESCAVRDRDRG